MSAGILSCGCPVPLDDDGCCTSCGWFPGMTEVATMTKPTPQEAVSAAPIPQGDDWLPTIERDEEYAREYIRMAGWEVQTKGKGSTFRICDPKGDRLPIPDNPYLHDTLTRMAHDIFDSWVKQAAALAASEARADAESARLGDLIEAGRRRIAELEAAYLHYRPLAERAEAAEQSLAEAVGLLREARGSVQWLLEQFCKQEDIGVPEPSPASLSARIDAFLAPKGEGATS